jgi:hypothetical protein
MPLWVVKWKCVLVAVWGGLGVVVCSARGGYIV